VIKLGSNWTFPKILLLAQICTFETSLSEQCHEILLNYKILRDDKNERAGILFKKPVISLASVFKSTYLRGRTDKHFVKRPINNNLNVFDKEFWGNYMDQTEGLINKKYRGLHDSPHLRTAFFMPKMLCYSAAM